MRPFELENKDPDGTLIDVVTSLGTTGVSALIDSLDCRSCAVLGSSIALKCSHLPRIEAHRALVGDTSERLKEGE